MNTFENYCIKKELAQIIIDNNIDIDEFIESAISNLSQINEFFGNVKANPVQTTTQPIDKSELVYRRLGELEQILNNNNIANATQFMLTIKNALKKAIETGKMGRVHSSKDYRNELRDQIAKKLVTRIPQMRQDRIQNQNPQNQNPE